MKKTFLFFMLLLPTVMFAQTFTLTPYGLFDAENPEKEFVVLDFDGKSASDLYSSSMSFINQTMKNPKQAIKADVADDYIRYDVFVPEITTIKKMGVKLTAEARYTVEMRFKDGKIRYNILSLSMPFKDGDKGLRLRGSKWGGWSVYDNKDNLYLKDQKAEIDAYFNNEVKILQEFVNNTGANAVVEDW